jgi:hypothetical protein
MSRPPPRMEELWKISFRRPVRVLFFTVRPKIRAELRGLRTE